jgi:hypothetical protein
MRVKPAIALAPSCAAGACGVLFVTRVTLARRCRRRGWNRQAANV